MFDLGLHMSHKKDTRFIYKVRSKYHYGINKLFNSSMYLNQKMSKLSQISSVGDFLCMSLAVSKRFMWVHKLQILAKLVRY